MNCPSCGSSCLAGFSPITNLYIKCTSCTWKRIISDKEYRNIDIFDGICKEMCEPKLKRYRTTKIRKKK